MAKTTLSITNFINCAKHLPAEMSVLLRADHGVGKSDITRELREHFAKSEHDGKDFPLIDRRLSQQTEGDMIGLPSTDGEVTRFNPPDWVKKACLTPCMLFLDEINRATPEVMQAAFQLVLDRELNGWKLHPQTRVYAAVNTGASYTVNEMDPALLDRFWVVDLMPTVDEWLAWARPRADMVELIPDYIAKFNDMLDPAKNAEPGTVQPSRRSWHRLSKSLIAAELDDKPDSELFYHMSLGFLGLEAAASFRDFAKNADFRVSAEDIFNNLVKKVNKNPIPGADADDTIYNKKLISRIKKMGQERWANLLEKVAAFVKSEHDGKDWPQARGVALSKFATLLSDELKITLWSKLVEGQVEDLTLIKNVHRYLAPYVMKSFGVPMGRAGVGVSPNIPDAFKPKS